MKLRAVLALATATLAACSTVPEALQGAYPALTPESTSARDIGRNVRWGGVILEARPEAERTCFEVLSRNLDRSMRPRAEDLTQGRFIACRDGFLDPEIFAKGREVTLTGRVERLDEHKVGAFDYTYPVLAAGFLTMWPKRPDVIIDSYPDPFYDPWYWGPYWGPYYRYPYYGRGGYGRTTARSVGHDQRIDVPAGQD